MRANKTGGNLRQPKVFQAPREEMPKIWPKFLKYTIPIFLLIFALIYVIFFLPWLKIKNIEIIGSPNEAVKNKIENLKDRNLFSFNANKLQQELANKNRSYASVKIYRGIPDTVRIVFENREPKLLWQSGENKYLIDADAIIYTELDDSDVLNLPLVVDESHLAVSIPMQIATDNFVDFVRALNQELLRSKFEVVNYTVTETTFQISAVLPDNTKLVFNTLRPLSDQIDALNKVYPDNKNDIKEYIDLRVEGRVYYK